ncbi:MAG: MliC family protein [Microcystaceae cyanobacterium]
MKIFCLIIVSFSYLVPGLVVAQTTEFSSEIPKDPIFYYCQKGKTFQVQFKPAMALLSLKPHQVYQLKQERSGSGVRYSDGKIHLYLKGQEGFIEINRKIAYDGCKSHPPEVSREVKYTCESQIAPYLNKESMTLEQAEKLLLQRDGNYFIYRCYPQ